MRKLGQRLVPGSIAAAAFAAIFTQLLHLTLTLVTAIPGVLAPVAAKAFGLHPGRVGVLVALTFIIAMAASLATPGVLARWGAARACQAVAAGSAIGLFAMAAAGYGAQWASDTGAMPAPVFIALLFVSALALGVPNGMINPISSMILFRAVPANLRAFFFSVKQTAVPGGYAVAGLLVPSLLLVMSWQAALAALGLAAIAWLLLTMVVHVEVSPEAVRGAPAATRAGRMRAFLEPIRTVWKRRAMREMALVSMVYSMNQTVMASYLVSYLNLEIGLSLVLSGAIFAALQLTGMFGRIVWGLSADLWVKPRTQLGLLGAAGGVCGLTVSLFTPAWSQAAMLAVCVCFGLTAVSWNGIFLSEVARLSARDDMGAMMAGTGVYNNLGALSGPGLCSLLVAYSGIYALGIAVFAVAPLILGAYLVLTRSPE